MSIAEFAARADPSWLRELRQDPEADAHQPNRKSRQVKSGHFVKVKPTPLPKPRLVIVSPVMAGELGLSVDACRSQEFLRFFSGDVAAIPNMETWATPYALSIMGRQMYDNCPFKNGNGYGDGRAISIGEVVAPTGQRWEMQLKGAGPTPFCRGADGRAVLRSSVREFLASEAMHHLGVSTTRALSLIVSEDETTQRPWYSARGDGADGEEEEDPRLASAPPELRQRLKQMLSQQRSEPDVMVSESCAMTCRVAPSFMRIGHLDLFARRATSRSATEEQREEHRLICAHAFAREFPDVLPAAPLPERAVAVFDAAVAGIAAMVAGWLLVGFCQGNFNCDNCLFAGRTMDYGPFGFIDKYDPGFAKWVGAGSHFAFMNQPDAALANLGTLKSAFDPLLDDAGKRTLGERLQAAKVTVRQTVDAMWCRKLGLPEGSVEGIAIFKALEEVMRSSEVDYTILFRQLAEVTTACVAGGGPDACEAAALWAPLRQAFYKAPCAALEERWTAWLRRWIEQLSQGGLLNDAAERLKQVNPKYILREHMLAKAYEAAKKDDISLVHELYRLIKNPYDEQPELASKYYCRAPDAALSASGVAVMN